MLSKEQRQLYIKEMDEYYDNTMDIEDIENILDNNTNIYYNCYDMEDVAMQYMEETGLLDSLDDNLKEYFDFEAYGRDMEIEGNFVFTKDGNCIEILW